MNREGKVYLLAFDEVVEDGGHDHSGEKDGDEVAAIHGEMLVGILAIARPLFNVLVGNERAVHHDCSMDRSGRWRMSVSVCVGGVGGGLCVAVCVGGEPANKEA
jgi:hypothetical protein